MSATKQPPFIAARPVPVSTGRIRVAVCDDSLVVRGAILRILRSEPGIEVVGQARNGEEALSLVRSHLASNPIEVIVLDIEMPVMDGLTALPALLQLDRRLKVVMASTLTRRNASISLQALHLGAADYIPKPDASGVANSAQFAADLLAKIRGLGQMRRRMLAPASPASVAPSAPTTTTTIRAPRAGSRPRLLAVGSSTGGPNALFTFFKALGPRLRVPVVLTQHMPASFIPLLAEHITNLGGMPCSVAREGEPLRRDHILVAPGDRHMLIRADGTTLRAQLSDEPPVNFCRPAVDPMLQSAAEACGPGGVLVLMLTGMGRDGLAGTRSVIERGGEAIAQDEASSVVWGMPGAIAQAGLCRDILPLKRLPAAIAELVGS